MFGKNLLLYIIGGVSYYFIEILWRGYSHYTMIVVGGISFILIGLINEYLSWKTPLWMQCGIATTLVLLVELISGCFINLVYNMNVWDYSDLPFNLFGQICLQYAILWYFLSAIAIIIDDILRLIIFDEKMYGYKLL